ncbi:MAG: penicillin-binding protein 2 [Candidatus Aminicenantes bacterium]|nr:penicillin-binding protein 2 [Candidatus Aminicenantes bacterium]
MKNSKIYEDLSLIKKRSLKVFLLVEILLVALAIYFWKIQIVDHDKYWHQSEANRIREVILPAPRGLIKDRDGKILADNIASFKASFIRENCENFDLFSLRVSRLLNIQENILKERIRKYKSWPQFKPIVFEDNLSLKEVSLIEGRKLEFPELVLQTEPKRFYPGDTFAAHTIGYLQELSEEEIKSSLHKERRLGDLVGRRGIEKMYDNLLRGQDGYYVETVDSLGRHIGMLEKRDPIQGYTLRLTIDSELQAKAEELLGGKEGAAVILNAQNGQVLALASYPTFDPNKFINLFSPEEWQDLINNPEFPLENRAIRGLYAPGSVFKLVIALGGLDSNLIAQNTSFFCSGSTRIYNQPFACWRGGGHGWTNLFNAIRNSCNIYFYNVGKRLGIEEIASYAKKLGYGSRTGIDLTGEKEGLVPSPEWKKKVKDAPWFLGETISVSIGQGPLLVTPLQIAVHTALIANRGVMVTPHILKSYQDPDTKEEKEVHFSPKSINPGIKSSAYEKVIRGMWGAVNNEGTARLAKIQGYDVCAKTGSTQVVNSIKGGKEPNPEDELKTHSWFTGFAPQNNPRVVVTVIVEFGGMGGASAAPLARKLFELYRKKYD